MDCFKKCPAFNLAGVIRERATSIAYRTIVTDDLKCVAQVFHMLPTSNPIPRSTLSTNRIVVVDDKGTHEKLYVGNVEVESIGGEIFVLRQCEETSGQRYVVESWDEEKRYSLPYNAKVGEYVNVQWDYQNDRILLLKYSHMLFSTWSEAHVVKMWDYRLGRESSYNLTQAIRESKELFLRTLHSK